MNISVLTLMYSEIQFRTTYQFYTRKLKIYSLINAVIAKVFIEKIEETRLLKISIKDKDPEQASQIANVLAKQYIEFNLSNRMEASKNTLDWMNNELYNLKKKLEEDEKAFFDFKQSKKVFSLTSKQKMVDQKLSEFNSNYLDTRNQRLDLDSKIGEIEKNFKISRDLANVRSLISNPTIENVYTKVKNLEIQYANLSKVYKSKHPKIIQIKDGLAKNSIRLDNELQKELTSLKSKRTVLYSREQVLKDTIQEFEQDALNTSGNELEYSILQRNLNTSKHLYDTLLTKMKESDVLKTSDSSHILLVEEAITPVRPVSPDTRRNIMLGIILGLFGGVGAAFFLEYMDQTVRTDEDVQKHLDTLVLSVIPKADKTKNLLSDLDSGTRYAESFRTLRTNLNFSSMDKELRSIVVTSSVQSEGKTNTAINLAYTIAQSGSRVLLIDADLRRPRLTGLFSLKKDKGFTDIISTTFNDRISEGKLEDYSIGDLLHLIKLQKRTGELHIESNGNKVAISFISGKVVDVYWKNRPESKKLASTLIRKELLTKEEASLALDHQKKSIQRLGSILFTMGLVSKEKLSKELTLHTVVVMRLISGMIEGVFHFNTQSLDEIRASLTQNAKFEKLFKEFLGERETLPYINSSIDAVIYPAETENIFILPSGKSPHNPSELIGSNGTEFLMKLLGKKFDFIILDTPPVLPATDAILMAPRTDGTLLVIKSGNTERKIIKDAMENFRNAQLPILGTVLNFVDLKKEGYYRYYKKYYSSYYGD